MNCNVRRPPAAKPPLGLMPRRWLEERLDEVCGAIDRYQRVGKAVPMEWYREMVAIALELGKDREGA